MRKSFLSLIPVAGAVLLSCSSNRFEENNIKEAFFDWGVANYTNLFGESDSLYYVINPIGNVSDTLFFNGNYTDSYYRADSTRVVLAYTPKDSLMLNIDRMYAVQTNPPHLLLTVVNSEKVIGEKCIIRLDRDKDNDNLYRCKSDSNFLKLLQQEEVLEFSATNCNSASEPQGSQNYEFTINAIGFMQAIDEAVSLNP